MKLGTTISKALAAVGVTEDLVTLWLGEPCGCPERIAKLDAVGAWAERVVRGKVEKAVHYLNELLTPD